MSRQDLENQAIDWLCKAFGFEVRLKVEGEKGEVVHSELTYGDGVIMVSQRRETPAHRNFASPMELGGKNTGGLMVYVDDVDAHCKRAAEHGAKITLPVELHDYGEEYWADRSYGCTDLDGHEWWFTQRVRG